MLYPEEPFPGEELPFLNVHRYLSRAAVPVPALLGALPERRLLFLEDLGDLSLEGAVAQDGPESSLPLYEEAVETLLRIQHDGTRALDGRAAPRGLAFDVRKLSEEVDFFFEHAVRGYLGYPLDDTEERALEDRFLPFLEEAASLPRVLAHRDYHSRNLMVRRERPAGGRLSVIDFQDARMGSVFYDLASLLRDAYVTLPEAEEEGLRYAYLNAAPAPLRHAIGERGAFLRRLDGAALQRNVKAIGTFGYQAHRRGKRFYLRFIPPTVKHLLGNFARNPAMRPLASRLSPLLSALAEKAGTEAAT
jgi:aminoglycoside/choline kinase family phosphotransferase